MDILKWGWNLKEKIYEMNVREVTFLYNHPENIRAMQDKIWDEGTRMDLKSEISVLKNYVIAIM